ncbi:hypothetical protein M426DRAFT_28089 [Hypoxylon sp. CI-4A]|nr:hypothetical protein M426DRAFT_28089 [Hypoxylon sp. CI-4A]
MYLLEVTAGGGQVFKPLPDWINVPATLTSTNIDTQTPNFLPDAIIRLLLAVDCAWNIGSRCRETSRIEEMHSLAFLCFCAATVSKNPSLNSSRVVHLGLDDDDIGGSDTELQTSIDCHVRAYAQPWSLDSLNFSMTSAGADLGAGEATGYAVYAAVQ